jgi:hypothetical protein
MISGHTRLYKFVREDGQFLRSYDEHGVYFAESGGMEYLTNDAAHTAWRQYEFHRLKRPEQERPPIKKVTYSIEVKQLAVDEFAESPAAMRVTTAHETYGAHASISQFVRRLAERPDFMEFKFIIVRKEAVSHRNRTLVTVDLTAVPNALLSSRKTNRQFIAVKTLAEMLYLRMALADKMKGVVDLDTAKYVVGDEYETEDE